MSTGYNDDYLTRAELAATCKVSKRTIRRWEKSGKITPFKSAGGIFLYRVDDAVDVIGDRPIVRLRHARVHVPYAADASGELTAKVFDMLDTGKHPVNIIRTLRVNAELVEGLTRRWLRWRKAVLFSPADAVRLASLLDVTATRDATELVNRVETAIEKLEEASLCTSCKQHQALICEHCHKS